MRSSGRRTYTELSQLETLEERFAYLRLNGAVAAETFGTDRWLNQQFYQSAQWKAVRREVIIRDMSCDLGVEGFDIHESIYIHHMNPMTPEDLKRGRRDTLDPEFLISVTHRTHNAIHYGDESQLPRIFVGRSPNDHIPWLTRAV